MTRALLALLAVFLALLLTVSGAFAFSTVSLSRVDFSSNDQELRGPAWLLTVVENGNNQYAVGTIDNTQVTRSDGATAQHDLKIELSNTLNSCQYAFTNNNVPIYSIEYRPASFWSAENQCTTTTGCIMTWRSGPAVTDVFNIIRTPSANANPLSTPTTLTSTSITLTARGETANAVINNSGARSAKLGNQAFAEWQGNLVSGAQCPNPLDSGVMGIKQDQTFFIANKAAYDAYRVDQEDLIGCFNSVNRLIQNGKTEGQKCVDAYNTKTKAVLTKTAVAPFSAATISSAGNGTGQATFTLTNNVQFPQLSLRVKADWLGVYLPVGKPDIQSVSACSFTEGSTASVQATIKNVGDAEGSFSIGVSCEDAVAQLGTSNTLKVAPGTTSTVPITVTGQTSDGLTTARCTLTATDFNQPDNKDTQDFTCTIKPQTICQPNLLRCNDNTIQSCSNDGSKWVAQETCLNGCTSQNGVPVCQNAELCSTDAMCDDNDDTTIDQCVGIVTKQCKHVTVPATPEGSSGSIPLKLLGFGIAMVVFALITYFLASNGQVLPAVGTGLVAVACLVGVIIGVFASFSVLSAWLITIALVLFLVGIGVLQYAPGAAIICFIAGAICVILGIMLFFTCSDPGWLLSWVGVCS